jgi:hypothetical protein
MKGETQGFTLKGTSAYVQKRSKEAVELQIGAAETQRYVKDVTSDHELTPDRTPTMIDDLS